MRLRNTALLVVLLASVVIGGAEAAQTGTIKVNTRLVQINVVVRDKNGPVSDLTKDDFTILDNGKAQRIDVFSTSDSRKQQQASLGAMPPGFASNLIDAAGDVPNSATVILFDLMNSSNNGQSQAGSSLGGATGNLSAMNDTKDAVKELVSYLRTVREGERVALFILANDLHVVQDFTGDPNVLFRAAARIKALDLAGVEISTQEQLAAILEPPPVSNDDGTVTYVGTPGFANAVTVGSAVTRATTTADAFEALARHMSGLPGRKSLIWMSAGFPFKPVVAERKLGVAAQAPVETPDDFSSQVNRAAKSLNDAGVSIYPVDYQGLKGAYPEVMVRLASATGGNVTYRTNDLKEAVTTAVADGDVSYTLGFYPANDDGKLHELKVKVNRKDVDVHHRSEYYATAVAVPEKERQTVMSQLIGSDANSSQISLVVSGEQDAATPGSYKVTISIDGANLNLAQQGDRRTGKLRLAMRLQSSKSKNANLGDIPLSFTEEQFQNVMKRGFVIRQSVQALPGDRLRIVVQDQTTGLAGAVWLPLVKK